MKIKSVYTDGAYKVFLQIHRYVNNQNLAIQILVDEGHYYEPYGMLTVNLTDTLPEDMAYVDTNNIANAEEFIKEYKLGEPTGKVMRSGFCEYPLYRFDLETVNKYVREEA